LLFEGHGGDLTDRGVPATAVVPVLDGQPDGISASNALARGLGSLVTFLRAGVVEPVHIEFALAETCPV